MKLWTNMIDFFFYYWVKSVHTRSYSGPHVSRIVTHSDWIRRDTPYLSVSSANAGKSGKNADQNNFKYGPRKHLLVFKTCLEDVFNTFSAWQFYVFQDVLEDKKLLPWRHLQDILKTYLEFKTSSRRLGGKQNVY